MSGILGHSFNQYFDLSENKLRVDGVRIGEIIAKHDTPLFVYSEKVLDLKWKILRNSFPPEFSIYYSLKANPNPFLASLLVKRNCGLEVASGGEFFLALRAGCHKGKVMFAGPGKTEAELEYVLANGIGEIHAESLLEVERISAISRKLEVRARVALRINPKDEAQGGAMRMGGKSIQFGIDEEVSEDAIDRVLSDSALEFRGIHLFSGTQILDHAVLIRQYRKALELGLKTATRIGRPLDTLDFGGGLGIPYFPNEPALNMDALRAELDRLMTKIRQEPLFAGTQFMLEPGRYLVGEAGIYVARVTDIKVSRGKKFLILDGGMNHHLAASGNLGQVIKKNFPIAILNKIGDESREKVDVVGPLCTPLDVLARDAELPVADVGDLVGVFQSGAYARTASPLGFLSHPMPPEVLIQDGQARLIRRRGTYEDLMRDTELPQEC